MPCLWEYDVQGTNENRGESHNPNEIKLKEKHSLCDFDSRQLLTLHVHKWSNRILHRCFPYIVVVFSRILNTYMSPVTGGI